MTTKYRLPRGIGAPKHAVQSFAEDFAEMFSFEPGGSLEELVSKTGGKLVFGSSGTGDEESGSVVARGYNDYTIYLSLNTSRKRDRFTIAHEIGHLALHLQSIKEKDPDAVMRATRWVNEEDEGQRRAEWEANWFAAALLMPEVEFREAFKSGGLELVQAKFDVSAAAANTRARSLGLIC